MSRHVEPDLLEDRSQSPNFRIRVLGQVEGNLACINGNQPSRVRSSPSEHSMLLLVLEHMQRFAEYESHLKGMLMNVMLIHYIWGPTHLG
jgi:hypothetical protein